MKNSIWKVSNNVDYSKLNWKEDGYAWSEVMQSIWNKNSMLQVVVFRNWSFQAGVLPNS